MTVTDQLKTIDNKIKANQGQYDLDRLAAKISVYSSGDLRKYEYLTGKDLGYKPSVLEQAKFDYCPLGNIFTKGLDKDDKKERLFKRLENIKDKNDLLKEIKNKKTKELGNKDSQTAKAKNSLIYDQNHNFYKYRLDKFFNISPIESKFDMLEMFYRDCFSLKSLEAKTKETADHKFVVLNNAFNEYDKLIKDVFFKNL